jgi:N utilization substance protein B
MANHPPGEVFKLRLEAFPLTEELTEFARQIIFGILPLTQELDQLIAKYAPDWPLDQIAAIDRNILRMALWEFAIQGETPISSPTRFSSSRRLLVISTPAAWR